MLLSFTLENYASIRDRQKFDMFLSRRKSGSEPEANRWGRNDVSPVAVIFGGNASGKSTLVSAFAYVVTLVENSYKGSLEESELPYAPFRLNSESSSRPTTISVEFVARDGDEYFYEFAVDSQGVVSERLDVFKTHKSTLLFKRDRAAQGDEWVFGRGLVGLGNRIAETCSSQSLFLSAASANKRAKPFRPALNWLTEQLGVYDARDYPAEHSRVMRRVEAEPTFRAAMDAFIQFADLGSTDLQVVEVEYSNDDLAEMRTAFDSMRERFPNADDASFDDFLRLNRRQLQLRHRGESGVVPLPFHMESAGTHALISFASLAVTALASGGVHVVDEIDASLHPLLVQSLVDIFLNPATNPLQAQLICTTHDATLIDRRIGASQGIRRDQVWLVEKNPDGATELVPLTAFKGARDEDNLARRYLAGRWGGIPNLALGDALADALTSAVSSEMARVAELDTAD